MFSNFVQLVNNVPNDNDACERKPRQVACAPAHGLNETYIAVNFTSLHHGFYLGRVACLPQPDGSTHAQRAQNSDDQRSFIFLWDCHADFSGVAALGVVLIVAVTALTFSSGRFVEEAFSGRQ